MKIGRTNTDTLIDIDGNVCKTLKIGGQIWIAENLKVIHYRNGDAIPKVTNHREWLWSKGAYCAFHNTESNAEMYGYLYDWYAVNDSRGIAPEGWHVPTDVEWQILVDHLGGESVAGGKLKEVGTAHWSNPDTGATSASGFSALPGGYLDLNGYFVGLGDYAYFWSSSEHSSDYAWYRSLDYDYSGVSRYENNKHYGFSVRLIQD
jgi:uncharacterized protein (TIGR02145 family)